MSCGYDEVSAAVSAKQPPIVDVRTEDEFASGRIPGATNIPLSEVKFGTTLCPSYFLYLSRWNMPLVCPRRSFKQSMGFPNPPRRAPSSPPARWGAAPPRWGTNWMRWDTKWWRLTRAPSRSGSRWAEKLKNKRLWLRLGLDCWYGPDLKWPNNIRLIM